MTLSKLSPISCYDHEVDVGRFSALTFEISFETAQFKKHLLKLYRDTYLIPLPSTVAGISCAILGVEKSLLKDFVREKELYSGAMLLNYDGLMSETMTVVKMKNWREIIRTPKRNVILFRPSYKFAIASSDHDLIQKLLERIETLNFEFDLFGGNDYNFVSDIGRARKAELKVADSGYGYCKLGDLIGFEGDGVIQIDEVNEGYIRKYAFGYRLKLRVNRGLAVFDGDNSVFVHNAWKFLR